MAQLKVDDHVRWQGAEDGKLVGVVRIVSDYNGDAHVRFPDPVGMVIIPTSELQPVEDDQRGSAPRA